MRHAAAELRESGVELELREVRGRDTGQVLRELDNLISMGVCGLAVAANGAPEFLRRVDGLFEQGIPVVTLNTDAPGSRRLCFVGMDNYRAGQAAAWPTTAACGVFWIP